MKDKKLYYQIIISSILIMILGGFLYFIYYTYPYAKDSAQSALLAESVLLLDKYYSNNNKYPDMLSELDLTFPDCGDPSLLQDIEYETDGKSYTLKTVEYSTKKTIEIHKTEQTNARAEINPNRRNKSDL